MKTIAGHDVKIFTDNVEDTALQPDVDRCIRGVQGAHNA